MTMAPNDRRARRRARREEERRAGTTPRGRNPWLIPGLLGGILVLAALIAIVLPGTGRPSQGGSSSLPPTASAGTSSGQASAAGSAASTPAGSAATVITGASLPDFENPNGDPAVGLPAPEVRGADFKGKQVTIANNGKPKVIVFLAHWCPHCQREAPLLQAWVNAGGVPRDAELIAVATSIDPARPNYPPDAWLDGLGWTVPTIADPTNSVAGAYGLTAFPYFVFVGPDGMVRARAVGELPITNIEAVIATLKGG